jgi:ATP-dependent Clp protease ATP-binding subunit ClpA
MLVFSQNLSQSLSRAIAQAEQQSYSVATPEHVLLALLDDPDAIPVIQACNVDVEKLRGRCARVDAPLALQGRLGGAGRRAGRR